MRFTFNRIFMITLIGLVFLLAVPLQAQEEPIVSTLFYEASLREALNEVSLQTGVNIIYDETVVGTITIDLVDVPLERALEIMLISGGYAYHKMDDDLYLVGRPTPDSPMYSRLTETETIRLDYIPASQAVQLLPPYYEDFIRTSSGQDDLLTISAPPAVIESFKEDLEAIDTAPREISIEVVVTEVSTEVIKERGADLFGLTTDSAAESYSLEYDGIFALATAGPSGQLLANLRLLEQENKADIKANPSIRVGDRESANLFVGEERVIIIEREEDDDIMEDVEIGVALAVTPRIMADNEIRMEIAPEVSHFMEERSNQLIVRRSEISSVVRAKSGETITMAGMTLDEVYEYESKVPLLGNIPLVRWLFREETLKEGEREMLIFITAEIIEE